MSALPRGWVESALETLCISVSDGDHQAPPKASSGVPFITISSIWNGRIDLENVTRFVPLTYKEALEPSRDPARGDIVLSVTGSIGRTAIVENPSFVFQRHIALIKTAPQIEQKYLCYFFTSGFTIRHLEELATGTAQKTLSLSKLRKVDIPLPPLAEQKRIVAKLDALNAKSARARTELARIETLVSRYKQAVLSKAFSGELTSAEVSNWASCTLGDLALDVRYGTAEKCTYAPDLTPVLRIPNVANGRIDLSDLKHASFNEKELKKLALLEGDLLIIRSNGSLDLVGRSAVVDAAAAEMLFAGYLIRIRLALSKAMPSFIQYWMQSFAVRRTIEDAAKSTSGVNNVNSQQLQALQLKLPPIEEQHEIIRRIESAFAKIDRLSKEAKRALELVGRLDEAILAKAFRGELVPQNENDEAAEHLLTRIRAEREAAPKGKRGRGRASTAEKTTRNRSASAMNKSRQDVSPSHLSLLLKSTGGRKPASELWLQSEMDIDEFYKQLQAEIDSGQIKEGPEKGELVLANEN